MHFTLWTEFSVFFQKSILHSVLLLMTFLKPSFSEIKMMKPKFELFLSTKALAGTMSKELTHLHQTDISSNIFLLVKFLSLTLKLSFMVIEMLFAQLRLVRQSSISFLFKGSSRNVWTPSWHSMLRLSLWSTRHFIILSYGYWLRWSHCILHHLWNKFSWRWCAHGCLTCVWITTGIPRTSRVLAIKLDASAK